MPTSHWAICRPIPSLFLMASTHVRTSCRTIKLRLSRKVQELTISSNKDKKIRGAQCGHLLFFCYVVYLQAQRGFNCLKKSNAIRDSYEKHTLIANHTDTQTATKVVAQIEDASETAESDDDEESGF